MVGKSSSLTAPVTRVMGVITMVAVIVLTITPARVMIIDTTVLSVVI